MITAPLLQSATGCTVERAALFAGPLSDACQHYGIAGPARLSAFLAQIGHESGSLRHVREIDGGGRYEGRRDLGNLQPGDGVRYVGRGLIQCTGRSNYRQMGVALFAMGAPDFEKQPEALEEPRWAAWSAAAWWYTNGCNALADAGDFVALTKRINGGTNGLADRQARWERAKQALATHATVAPENTPVHPPDKPQPDYSDTIPAGEAPDWVPPENRMPIAPIIAALLPSIIEAIPKLGKVFGSGSEVSERNIKAAELVAETVKTATGALNLQDAAEKLKTNPEAVRVAAKAVDGIWYELTEAGGGGVDGARKADAAVSGGDIKRSPSFWVFIVLIPLVYLLVLSLIGLIGTATWSDDVRAGLAGSLISAIIGAACGYYFGQTTTRNRSAAP